MEGEESSSIKSQGPQQNFSSTPYFNFTTGLGKIKTTGSTDGPAAVAHVPLVLSFPTCTESFVSPAYSSCYSDK